MSKKDDEGMEEEDEEDMALGFKIYIEGVKNGQPMNTVTIRWIKGHDSVLFESFCGMLKRKLEGAMGSSRVSPGW